MTRKELVQALEARWGAKAKYLGMPSCDYELKCSAGTFIIDRDGVIRDLEGREVSAEELLREEDLAPDGETAPSEPGELPAEGYAVELPLAGHTTVSLRNLVNMLASKERLLISAFDLPRPLMETSLAEELGQRSFADMKAFQVFWAESQSGCCHGLKLDFENQTLTMKLLKDNPMPDEMAAFRDLAVCMTEYAKKLKHSTFKPAQEENPKYAMRTWLLRLGMNGDAFKLARKVLLARLAGSAAFRTPADEEKHKARLLAKKQKPCEVDGDVC
ncbi:hypothetical protein P22_2480 [Propionispora sp. 2/2-37]|uniref:hypothetical protein n=1 Tax=Propionispora sp. 2/2-37 TaxID=1677858 RepID=UPI0006BB6393|nr:hypothetical protein [Propionispora sp. 2/2-37]CUH96390.1 hypothetical protein P22_2480 [Propionispora sp. 2/2-37]